MMNQPPHFKGLNIKVFSFVIPIKGRGFINQESTLEYRLWGLGSKGFLGEASLSNCVGM